MKKIVVVAVFVMSVLCLQSCQTSRCNCGLGQTNTEQPANDAVRS